MKKSLLSILVLGTLTLSACNNTQAPVTWDVVEKPGFKTYSNSLFAIEYPEIFQLKEENFGTPKVITVSNDKGKIQIGNFKPDAGPAPTADMSQAQKDELPKKIGSYGYEGKVAVEVFYKEGDEDTAKAINKIERSIQLK